MNIRYIISIILLVLFVNLSQAQDVYIFGGVNFAKLGQQKSNSYNNTDKSYKPGFHIGTAIDIRLNDHFVFEPGALFSLKREYQETTVYVPSSENRDFLNSYKFKTSINEYYMDLPINIKFNFMIGNLDFYGIGGPYLSLRLFDNTNTKIFVDEEQVEHENTIQEKFTNRIDYGINTGLGVDMRSIVVQASFDYGFYREMKYEDIQYDIPLRNLVFRLTMGYRLSKKNDENQ